MTEFSEQGMSAAAIPMTYSRIAARALGLSERQLGQLMRGTSLVGDDLLRDDAYLTGYQQVQILENALDISNNAAFGLDYGLRITPSTHGPLGFLVNCSPTLIDSLEAFRDYLPLRMNLTAISVHRSEQWIECRLKVDPGVSQKVYRLFVETLSLATLSIAESILGRPLTEGELWLAYDPPSYAEDYRRVYSCQVHFCGRENLLRIPAGLADTANASSDSRNYELALNQCRELLQQMAPEQDGTRGRVRRMLLSNPNHQLTENEVARALFISRRTLARRLLQEHTSFREVRDEVLASLAKGYLLDTTLSVEVIATLLNYHDSANFRRAFKRWYKLTPDQFRRLGGRSRGALANC